MATHKFVSNFSRSKNMQNEDFLHHFNMSKEHIQQSDFSFVKIENDLVMYLFEAYCAMELDTCMWNTFRTH